MLRTIYTKLEDKLKKIYTQRLSIYFDSLYFKYLCVNPKANGTTKNISL